MYSLYVPSAVTMEDFPCYSDCYSSIRTCVQALVNSPPPSSIILSKVNFVTIVRTTGNWIFVSSDNKFCFDSLCQGFSSPDTTLDDSVLLSAKEVLERFFNISPSLVLGTIPYPVGAFSVNNELYIFVAVVLDNALLNSVSSLLKEGEFVRINSIQRESMTPKEKAVFESILLVNEVN